MDEIENGHQPIDAALALRRFLFGGGDCTARFLGARGCDAMNVRHLPLLVASV
jgi:hypothetical protein